MIGTVVVMLKNNKTKSIKNLEGEHHTKQANSFSNLENDYLLNIANMVDLKVAWVWVPLILSIILRLSINKRMLGILLL